MLGRVRGGVARGIAGLAIATATAVVTVVAPAGPAVAWSESGRGRIGGELVKLRTGAQELHGLGITGVQALSRNGGRVALATAGVADLTTGEPVPRDGYFRMGSNTKTFTAVLVLQLVGEGRLSLDDTVDQWLPGVVAGNGNDGSRVTVRQLLQHTSGIVNYTDDLPAFASLDAFMAHRFDHHRPEDLVAIAMRHAPEFAPGTHWDYSNTNYVLAGMIIERVTGRSWAQELRTRILRPLGLRHTVAPGDVAELPDPHATAYQQFAPGGPLVDTTELNPTAAYAAGALITTPSDLATFWQALQRGRLLAPAQQAAMHETVLAETFQDFVPGVRYGLGIMWMPNGCGGYWGHGGDVPGMSTADGVTADGRHAVVFSLSTQLGAEDAALAVERSVYQTVDDLLCPAG